LMKSFCAIILQIQCLIWSWTQSSSTQVCLSNELEDQQSLPSRTPSHIANKTKTWNYLWTFS
jgi:hypothetical protein